MPDRGLIIAANRSPVDIQKRGRSHPLTMGGLVQAMGGIGDVWIGHAGGKYDYDNCGPNHVLHCQAGGYDMEIRKVFLTNNRMEGYRNNFSNGFLWPGFHLIKPEILESETFHIPGFRRDDYFCYRSVNEKLFADAVLDEHSRRRGAAIWIQDYHLLLLPREIRRILNERGEKSPVGHFIHVPFPSLEGLGALREKYRELEGKLKKGRPVQSFGEVENVLGKLLYGMLGNDLLGFHIPEYVENFRKMVGKYLPDVKIGDKGGLYCMNLDGHETYVGDFPIGIDTERFSERALKRRIGVAGEGKSRLDLDQAIRESRADGRKVVAGIGRMDYTKGIMEGLDILEHLLERGVRLQYIGFWPLSREGSPGYKRLAPMARRRVIEINKKYKTGLGYEPVIFRTDTIEPPKNLRLMGKADGMLVTSLADGMCLVALESVYSKKGTDSKSRGFLALGEGCGASHALGGFEENDGIVRIDPLDAGGSADKIYGALNQTNISDRLIDYVGNRMDVRRWRDSFIDKLYEAASLSN